MNKNKRFVFVVVVMLFFSVFSLFAAEEDMKGKILQQLDYEGLKHISGILVDDTIYPYRNKQYTDDLFLELVGKLYDLDGVEYIEIDSEVIPESGNLKIHFIFHEIPTLESLTFNGNKKIRKQDLETAITTVSIGDFFDPAISSSLALVVNDVNSLYKKRGIETVDIIPSYTLNEEKNTVALTIDVTEGIQKRIVEIGFEGNTFSEASTLRSKISSKVKSLFNSGYLDQSKVDADRQSIVGYYQQNGYIDALVTDVKVEVIEPNPEEKPKDYQEVRLVFVIEEGLQWKFGGLFVTGNTVVSDEQIEPLITMEVGSIDNLERVSAIITNITDLYYNDGYIFMQPVINEIRDDQNLSIEYSLSVVENSQSKIAGVVFTGLTKTKEYVFEREVDLKVGDVFSKEKLVSSYQNIYNTGLLKNLTYNIKPAENGQDVIVEFTLEEGNQMDIQFGATFGGNVTGFPISGFLQWNDKNVGGTARTLSVNTTLSPDTQSVELSFGNNWAFQKRWSNNISLSFTRKKIASALQLGIGSERDDGNEDTRAYPLGYSSYEKYRANSYASPSESFLGSYNLLSFDIGYSTGYTFILKPGRLSFSSGISVGLNRALFDHAIFNPFEKLIYKYGQNWQFSNRLSLGFQFDGRDLIYYTTKGYVLSQSFTYAGGVLFGLSNYIKSTTSAAGYLKLFGVTNKEGVERNCIISLSSSLNLMLPQYYKKEGDSQWAWHPASEGATRYEMLYIDGMTIGRGFDVLLGQSFLWDNMLEASYPLVKDVLNAEAFTSGTAVHKSLAGTSFNTLSWYFAAGAGVKLKIPGFPIGLYIVKNATFNTNGSGNFAWQNGSLFWGTKLVLAISTSLI